ncbi:MAG TPA: permease prefix domain 1-containing protein [Steroidobacteraceae bacterium]
MNTLEEQISHWREYLRRHRSIGSRDVAELEDHLRDQVGELTGAGLAGDEAFLIAVKRMGGLDSISLEFAREHSDRLWKQLVIPAHGEHPAASRSELFVVVILAVVAAMAIKIPPLFGLELDDGSASFYARNLGLFVLPALTGYFGWKRRLGVIPCGWLVLGFVAAGMLANVYPFTRGSDTEALTALHLPIACWLLVGIAYVGGGWFSSHGRMNFVRFSGELFIYYVLIALGGMVLTAFTVMMFEAIHVSYEWFVQGWLIPCGAMAAVIVGSWLVEAKQSVIENMAPVLTRLFTPLFTLVLLVFLATMLFTGHAIDMDRNLLIGFDLLLALVVGLVLYAASARDEQAAPGIFDALQLVLVVSALLVDLLALAAIVSRISEFGFTPNRVAALGENLILLVNLAGTAWYYGRFVRHRAPFAGLERWQLAFLPIYSLWAALVVMVFPPLFDFA